MVGFSRMTRGWISQWSINVSNITVPNSSTNYSTEVSRPNYRTSCHCHQGRKKSNPGTSFYLLWPVFPGHLTVKLTFQSRLYFHHIFSDKCGKNKSKYSCSTEEWHFWVHIFYSNTSFKPVLPSNCITKSPFLIYPLTIRTCVTRPKVVQGHLPKSPNLYLCIVR